MNKIWMILFACSVTLSELSCAPSQWILIRHAEKPTKGKDLSYKGYERAAALVPFMTLQPASAGFNTPQAIFAQSPSKNHHSHRPILTVTPLAQKCNIVINSSYTYDDYKKMVDDINADASYDNQTILICWAYQNLSNIASYIGVDKVLNYPSKQFDRLWIINMTDGKVSSYQDLSQRLLFGDAKS